MKIISGLPVGAIEYTFKNTGTKDQELVFSYNASNFIGDKVKSIDGGFVLSDNTADFTIATDDKQVVIDHTWFRGGWFDPVTMAWNHVENADVMAVPENKTGSDGASIYVPFILKAGRSRTIKIMMCWYTPASKLRFEFSDETADHKPWYAAKFKNVKEVAQYWSLNYEDLKTKTELFTNAFYKSTLPSEVTEAVAANLSILKSTTVLRQYDGRFWGWEGSGDKRGSCPGTCTHVYNYVQSLCHLFPNMERSIRETEFNEDEDSTGHQVFRATIPIETQPHDFYAAADGQLGGIMNVYRDWRISGDNQWLKKIYPKLKLSLEYCIRTWDPRGTGTLEGPHHNTYDIGFWGANGMTTSFYLGALEAFIAISDYLHQDASLYKQLLQAGKNAMETKLYNGQYFYQRIQWQGLTSADPVEASGKSLNGGYSSEAIALLQKEGPKYQYGTGCFSDGVMGVWLARVCGLPSPVDAAKVSSHLLSVYKYNFKKDLSTHSSPQRSTYTLGKEGGLLLCTWPNGGKLSLPFIYSSEVWTGIEYEVASHLIFTGHVNEGLEIVQATRSRYDGSIRNPFDEYECGHWYARAMSRYALIEALTGVRYDAVEKTLYMDSKVGDFVSFLSTDTGFGNVVYKNGKASVKVVYGKIDIQKTIINHTKSSRIRLT